MAAFLLAATAGCGGGGGRPGPVAGHPRLFLDAASLPDLRSRATADNPFYASGLRKVAEDYKTMMDAGQIPVAGDDCADATGFGGIICEWPMEVFGLMANVDPDPDERDDYGRRARKLLMTIIELAKQGPSEGDPIRDPTFPVGNRSKDGEAFGLAVDWAYPWLTDGDKADIRQVFLAWAAADVDAMTTTDNHPVPVGVFNDPRLLQDKAAVRFAGNNYFTSHERNLGLMAMALDPADDPGGQLHAYLDNATGAFLYMTDALLRGDAKGGLLPEGYDYDSLTASNIGQLMLALHTAGEDDPSRRGRQVQMSSNPFYEAQLDTYLHTLVPATTFVSKDVGSYYAFYPFGDQETIVPYADPLQDPISGFASVALVARDTGDVATYDKVRWIQAQLPPGGKGGVVARASSKWVPLGPIFYFLLMDPKASPDPPDPRMALSNDFWDEGLSFLFSRTGWGPDASYFVYQNEWMGMDHRHADDNHFSLFRKGEWITCERSGYGGVFFTGPAHNNLAVQNDMPIEDLNGLTGQLWQSGSAYVYEADGDPEMIGHSFAADYAYALGDSTGVHDGMHIQSTGVTHVSRSVFWLEPDHVITYDRAVTAEPGRFKRVYLQLPGPPTVSGLSAEAQTPGNQSIFYTALLPTNAVLSSDPPPSDRPAEGAPMTDRLRVEAPDMPLSARFLGVLQAADAGASADPATLVRSDGGTAFEGVVVAGAAVLFPDDLGAAFTSVTFTLPASVTKRYVTGLTPGAMYDVIMMPAGSSVTVTVEPGSTKAADAGGVLAF